MKIKKTIEVLALSLVTVSISTYVMAAEQNIKKSAVPKVIISSFEKSYPKATVLNFTKETKKGITIYEIESKDGTTKRDISYAANGQLLEIEEGIAINSLPKDVLDTLNKSFPKGKVLGAERIAKGMRTMYEVEINNNNKKMEVVFENGKILKAKKHESDNDNERNEKGEGKEKGEDNEK